MLETEQGVRLGRDMIEAELKRVGWNLARVKSEGLLRNSLKRRGNKEVDAFFLDVARGQTGLAGAVRELLPEGVYESKQDAGQKSALQSLFNRFRQRSETPVLISGEDGMLVTYAKCCAPLPGESVSGFITRGRGITIHRNTCDQLRGMDPERRIAVEWAGSNEAKHSGEIEIYCHDRPGMLANISSVCERAKLNIQRIESKILPDDKAVLTLRLAVRDVGELTRLIRFIKSIKGVDSVHRTLG
jgi:GTP pyrophosphokinase